MYFYSRNVDSFDKYYDRILKSFLVTAQDPAEVDRFLEEQESKLARDLARLDAERNAAKKEESTDESEGTEIEFAQSPRLFKRGQFLSRVNFSATV